MTRQRTSRSHHLLWGSVAVALAVIGSAALVRGAAPSTSPASIAVTMPRKTVTNIWIDTDLRQVIQDISAQTDTVIICDQSVQGSVSMSVKEMSLTDCLERACAAGGYTFTKVKDYYVVGKAEPGQALFQSLSEPQRIKLSYLQPDQIKAMLHTTMLPYVNFDKASGTVMVTAPEPMRQRILNAIHLVDQPGHQISIEAIVFELTQEGSKDLGLDWRFRQGMFAAGSKNQVSALAYDSNSDQGTYIDTTLRAIVEGSKGQVLANPRVLVADNTEANIFVGQEQYFSLLSGQASNPYYTLQSIKAGVSLTVTPYIGEAGEITLNLEPEVSDVITDDTKPQTINGSTGSSLPVITRRHAKTSIQIKDGQTVFLGGLIRERHRATTSKVPVAGDIPGLGAAFRNVHDQKEQQEVVILITANIVDNRKAKFETVAPRLEKRYVSPLDAISPTP